MKDKLKIFKSKLKKFCSKYKNLIFALIVVVGLVFTLFLSRNNTIEKHNNDTSVQSSNTSIVKRANNSSDEYTQGYNNGYNAGYEAGLKISGNLTAILQNSITQVFSLENDESSSNDTLSVFFTSDSNSIIDLQYQLSTLYSEIGLNDTSSIPFRWKIFLPYSIPISLFYFTFSNWNVSSDIYVNFYGSIDSNNFIKYRLQDFTENVFKADSSFMFEVVEIVLAPINLNSNSSITFSNQEYYEGFYQGYDQGLNNGSTIGYDKGFEAGKTEGYNNGYNVGYEDGSDSGNVIGDALLSISDIPFSILSSFLGFEIFGFNVLTLFTGLLTIGLVIWILKKFF